MSPFSRRQMSYEFGKPSSHLFINPRPLSQVGSGSAPIEAIPTKLLSIKSTAHGADTLSKKLRLDEPPIFTRVKRDAVLLDFRTIRDGEDKLVREAAVAGLGAIGDERARPTLLHLIASGPPQIRRRCVPALSVFDGEDIAAALLAAATDRNPMVREAAEMVVGRQTG